MSALTFARSAISEALEAALRSIGDGRDQWATDTTPVVQKRRAGNNEIATYPTILYFPAPSSSRHDANAGAGFRVQVDQPYQLEVSLRSLEPQKSIDLMEHDLRLAIDQDPTLNGTCFRALISSIIPWLHAEDEPDCGLYVTVQVRFRYLSTAPSEIV